MKPTTLLSSLTVLAVLAVLASGALGQGPVIRSYALGLPKPDYDSGWVLGPGQQQLVTLTHNVGGDPGRYIVEHKYRSPDGSIKKPDMVARWMNLTSSLIDYQSVAPVEQRILIWRAR